MRVEDDQGFIKVSRKKSAKRAFLNQPKLPSNDSLENVEPVFNRVRKCVEELNSSEFITKFIDIINNQLPSTLSEVVCYGLGSFSECAVARYQCALLCIIQTHSSSPVHVYDPVFSDVEKVVLKHLNFHLLPSNEEGKRTVAPQGTFFILPHCPKQLTNNLLYSNWSPQALSNSILLANSFSHIVDSTLNRILQEEAPHVLRISPYVEETPLPVEVFHLDDVFNHLSVHSFPLAKLTALSEEFWLDSPEPVYPDTLTEEFVKLQLG
nr:EOG090X0FII [Triops cancriformis]